MTASVRIGPDRATHPPPAYVSRIELPAATIAPRQARRHVRETLAAWNAGDDLLDTAALVVTELVTNAVLHATAELPIVLTLRRTATATSAAAIPTVSVNAKRLVIAVRDHDACPPASRESGPDVCGGRGLAIVDAVAERWSWYPVAEGGRCGKVVWCELPLGD